MAETPPTPHIQSGHLVASVTARGVTRQTSGDVGDEVIATLYDGPPGSDRSITITLYQNQRRGTLLDLVLRNGDQELSTGPIVFDLLDLHEWTAFIFRRRPWDVIETGD